MGPKYNRKVLIREREGDVTADGRGHSDTVLKAEMEPCGQAPRKLQPPEAGTGKGHIEPPEAEEPC